MNFDWQRSPGTAALTMGALLAATSLSGLSAQADAAATTAITNY